MRGKRRLTVIITTIIIIAVLFPILVLDMSQLIYARENIIGWFSQVIESILGVIGVTRR
jgi:hypothetical protein